MQLGASRNFSEDISIPKAASIAGSNELMAPEGPAKWVGSFLPSPSNVNGPDLISGLPQRRYCTVFHSTTATSCAPVSYTTHHAVLFRGSHNKMLAMFGAPTDLRAIHDQVARWTRRKHAPRINIFGKPVFKMVTMMVTSPHRTSGLAAKHANVPVSMHAPRPWGPQASAMPTRITRCSSCPPGPIGRPRLTDA